LKAPRIVTDQLMCKSPRHQSGRLWQSVRYKLGSIYVHRQMMTIIAHTLLARRQQL